MSLSSRLTLVIALSLGATACIDRSIAEPPVGGSGFAAPEAPAPSPIQLRAEFVNDGTYLVLSWSVNASAENIFGFLVERAQDAAGPWSFVAFTRNTSLAQFGVEEARCYRVTVHTSPSSDLDSKASRALCIAKPART